MQNVKKYFKNKLEAEISKRMIILSDENLKNMFLPEPYQSIGSSHGKTNEETCIGYSQMFSANDSSMNGT